MIDENYTKKKEDEWNLHKSQEESDQRSADSSKATPHPVGVWPIIPSFGCITYQRDGNENIKKNAQKLLHEYNWIHD